MSTKNAFTLIETVIVVLMISVFLLIAIPFHQDTFERSVINQFYQQFEDDLLLTQKIAMTDHSLYELLILPSQHSYYLYDPQKGRKIFERSIPKSLTIKLQTLQIPIRFSTDGTIHRPGSFMVEGKTRSYKITFPFGKSRCYMYEI